MISFRFDDARADLLTAYQLLNKYQFPAIAATITGLVRNESGTDGTNINWGNLTQFSVSGWDIISHTTSHTALTSLTANQVQFELHQSQQSLINHGFTSGARFFVPPGEMSDATVDALIARYYSACYKGIANVYNYYPFYPDGNLEQNVAHDRFHIWSTNYGDRTLAQIEGYIDTTIAEGGYINVIFHQVSGATATDLAALIEYVQTKVAANQLQVVTLSQLFDKPTTLIAG